MDTAQLPSAAAATTPEERFAKLPHALLDAVKRRVLTRDHAFIYAVVNRRRCYQSGVCRVRLRVLMEDAGCSKSQLLRYLADLVAHGFLAAERHPGRLTSFTLIEQSAPRLEVVPQPVSPVTPLSTRGGVMGDTSTTTTRVTHDTASGATHDTTPVSPVTPPSIQECSFKSGSVQELGTKPQARSSPGDPRRTRLTAEFVPDEKLRAWARAKGLTDRQIDETTESFNNFWIGDGRVKADWAATWRTWLLRELPKLRGRSQATRAAAAPTNQLTNPSLSPVQARLKVDESRYDSDGYDEHGIDRYGFDRDGWGEAGRQAGYSKWGQA